MGVRAWVLPGARAVGGVLLSGVAVTGLVLSASPASAAAEIERFSFTINETFADSPPECMPEVKAGVTTTEETVTGQSVTTPSGVSVHGTTTLAYRTDFPDGSFLTGSARDHFTFNSQSGVEVSKNVIREPRTIFSADGTPVRDVMLHFLAHTTFREGDDAPTVQFERFRFTCL